MTVQHVYRLWLTWNDRGLDSCHFPGQPQPVSCSATPYGVWPPSLAQWLSKDLSSAHDQRQGHAVVVALGSSGSSSQQAYTTAVVPKECCYGSADQETCLRRVDFGKLSLDDFFLLVNGSPAHLASFKSLPVGTVLLLQPNGSRTVKGSRAGVISLAHTSAHDSS